MIKKVDLVTPNKIIIFLISPLILSASLLDFRALDRAEEGYAEGNYSKAIEAYETLEEKSDEVIYDEANSHYKLQSYEKAKELYTAIKKESLAFKKWHNLGNTHAQLGELEEGIKAYEKALALKDDEDTRFNLELLKKRKEEQEKKDDKKQDDKNDEKRDDKKKDDKNKEKKEDSKDKKESEKNKDEKGKDKEKSPEEKRKEEDQKRQEEDKKSKDEQKEKSDEEKQQEAQAQMKKEPISEQELRKYQKMLDQRGINTLMVPLKTEGEENDELKPW